MTPSSDPSPVRAAALFAELCELDPEPRERRLREIEREDSALAAQVARLLELDAEDCES